MNNRMTAVMKMQLRNKWMWVLLPWIIMLSSFVVNLIISGFIEEPMYTGGLASIYFYMFVNGIIIITQTFPFVLGFSIRRKDFFLSSMMSAAVVFAGTSILLMLLAIAESQWTDGWGTQLHFFKLPYLNDGNIIEQLLISFIILFFMYNSGFLIASLQKRVGFIGLIIIFTALLLIFSSVGYLCSYYEWWGDIFAWLVRYSAFELALWLIPLTMINGLLSYLFLRRASVQ